MRGFLAIWVWHRRLSRVPRRMYPFIGLGRRVPRFGTAGGPWFGSALLGRRNNFLSHKLVARAFTAKPIDISKVPLELNLSALKGVDAVALLRASINRPDIRLILENAGIAFSDGDYAGSSEPGVRLTKCPRREIHRHLLSTAR